MVPLTFKCPTCGAAAHQRVAASAVATIVHDRTCRRCRAQWRFVIQPLPARRPGVLLHMVAATARLDAGKQGAQQ